MRGLRGATTVSRDGKEEIWQAAKVLMDQDKEKSRQILLRECVACRALTWCRFLMHANVP